MRKWLWLVVLLFVFVSGAWVWRAVGGANKPKPRLASPAEVKAARRALSTVEARALIDAHNDFALRLLLYAWKEQPDTNLCVCPVGVSQVLRLAQLGSAGKTKAEYAALLRSGKTTDAELAKLIADLQTASAAPDPYVKTSIANCLWMAPAVDLRPAYADLLKKSGAAEVRSAAFGTPAAAAEIASWFRDHTEGKLGGAGGPKGVGTGFLFTNAVYFKGTWKSKFDTANTYPEAFKCFGGEQEQVPMMHLEAKFGQNPRIAGNALRIPYGNGDVAMYVYLPEEKKGIGLAVKELAQSRWFSFVGGFSHDWDTKLSMPRFKSDWSADLTNPLRRMGLKTPFDSRKADFSRLSATKPLWAFSLNQATTISVDEEGTEAAAAVEHSGGCAATGELTLNRPFIYAIVDDSTGVILFLGVYGKP